jgi:hypothetical protein
VSCVVSSVFSDLLSFDSWMSKPPIHVKVNPRMDAQLCLVVFFRIAQLSSSLPTLTKYNYIRHSLLNTTRSITFDQHCPSMFWLQHLLLG